MSQRQHEQHYGIEPFGPERDRELEAEARTIEDDERLSRSEEPILRDDDDEQSEMSAWANSTEDLY